MAGSPDALSAGDAGRTKRFIMQAEGWTGVSDPVEFERMYEADLARLGALLAEVREDERRRVGRALSKKANSIFNRQVQDYPSNVLDKVSLHLTCGEPLEFQDPTPRVATATEPK